VLEAGMNPLHWKRTHQIAWMVSIAAGGLIGLIFGWLVSPFSHVGQVDSVALLAWLHFPLSYLPFVAAGAVTAGLAYYSADLLTGAR
jgi:hypothetical protein